MSSTLLNQDHARIHGAISFGRSNSAPCVLPGDHSRQQKTRSHTNSRCSDRVRDRSFDWLGQRHDACLVPITTHNLLSSNLREPNSSGPRSIHSRSTPALSPRRIPLHRFRWPWIGYSPEEPHSVGASSGAVRFPVPSKNLSAARRSRPATTFNKQGSRTLTYRANAAELPLPATRTPANSHPPYAGITYALSSALHAYAHYADI